jgi:DNA-binding CsgD family transcriptional regulator
MRKFPDPACGSVPIRSSGGNGSLRGMADTELTEREREAAILLAYGHTNGDVARELHVSLRTAEGERSRLMRKLGFQRRSQLVRWAIQRGLLH